MDALPPLARPEQAALPVRIVVDGGRQVVIGTIHDRVDRGAGLVRVRAPAWLAMGSVAASLRCAALDGIDYHMIRPRWWVRDGVQWVERTSRPGDA